MMALKVDLYVAHEGKDLGARTNARKGGHCGGKFCGQKGKLGTIEEGPQPDSVTTVAELKKLQKLNEKC